MLLIDDVLNRLLQSNVTEIIMQEKIHYLPGPKTFYFDSGKSETTLRFLSTTVFTQLTL